MARAEAEMRIAIGLFLVAAVVAVASAQSPAAGTTPLPAAVQASLRQTYSSATVSSISQDRDEGRVVFKIAMVDKGRRRDAEYDEAGTLVESAEQVDEAQLPAAVAAAMHSHPRAIYVTGMKVTRGANVRYELTVRGTRKTAMVARADGTVLSFK
jgi:hypothetical protein